VALRVDGGIRGQQGCGLRRHRRGPLLGGESRGIAPHLHAVDPPVLAEVAAQAGLVGVTGHREQRLGLLGEAQDVQHRTGIGDGVQRGEVVPPLLVGEAVHHRRVERRVETAVDAGERGGVGDGEVDLQPALGGLGPGLRDRRRRGVERGDLQPSLGQEQGVVAEPAAALQHRAGELAGVGQLDDQRLRAVQPPGDDVQLEVPDGHALPLVERVEVHHVIGHRSSPQFLVDGDVHYGRA
jgi:hypothetical protein